jgi:hypothetical protein
MCNNESLRAENTENAFDEELNEINRILQKYIAMKHSA